MLKDTDMSAAALYDGGWRAKDRDQLIEEYSLTEADADAICEKLAEYQKGEGMKKYQVIEDNGGGLTLVVFGNHNTVEYLHTGYEYIPGQLAGDLDALKAGDTPATDWDGNADDPQATYDNITSYEYGWEVVADNDGVYPDKMGVAARIEFGIAR